MRLLIPGLVLAVTIYCLIDVVRSEQSEVRGLPKLVWVLLVLLFPLAGGAAWFVAGRPRGTRPPGTERLGTPKPRVLGPDDDPDFLRTIDRPRPVAPVEPLDDEVPPPPVVDGAAPVMELDPEDRPVGPDDTDDTDDTDDGTPPGQDDPTAQDGTTGRDDRTT